MKTIILLLLLTIGVQAQTNFHFYYGFKQSLGAELLINGTHGIGFAGTTEESNALGVFSTGKINEWDRKNIVSTTTQKWFALYTTIGAIYIKDLQISIDVGGALYGRHMNFLDPNRNEYYHKKDAVNVKGLIGINVTHPITKDIGWQIGVDTFNGINTGFIIYF
jgi:hypothetical protein